MGREDRRKIISIGRLFLRMEQSKYEHAIFKALQKM